jgi:hypothetical protein
MTSSRRTRYAVAGEACSSTNINPLKALISFQLYESLPSATATLLILIVARRENRQNENEAIFSVFRSFQASTGGKLKNSTRSLSPMPLARLGCVENFK